MIHNEQRLLIGYVAYCMEQAFLADQVQERERAYAFKRLAEVLQGAHPSLESIRENLCNHWSRLLNAPKGYAEACAEVQQLVEADMCFPVYSHYQIQMQQMQLDTACYALRDIVQALGIHGVVEACDLFRHSIECLEFGIQTGEEASWRQEQIAIYQEALRACQQYIPPPTQEEPFFVVEMPEQWSPDQQEIHVVRRRPADVLYPTGKIPRVHRSQYHARLAASECNRLIYQIEMAYQRIEDLCFESVPAEHEQRRAS